MSTPTVKGINALTFGGNDFEFDPRRGIVPNYPYTGPFEVVKATAFSLMASRIPFRFTQDGAFASITLVGNIPLETGAPAEVPVDKWDLRGNEVQIDIHLHPNSLAIDANTPGALKQIDYDISLNNLTAVASPRADGGTTVNLPTVGAVGGFVLALKALLGNGQDYFEAVRPVLRHTYTVSDNYTGNAFNFSNAESIYTTGRLLTECATFPYPLPGPYVQAINSLPVLAAVGYMAGWKKCAPDFNTAARLKNEIVTEFKYDLWNTAFLYPVIS